MVASKFLYDLVTIGSVTIDITQTVSDEYLKEYNLKKTDSNYIDAALFNRLAAHPDIKMKTIGGPSTNIITAMAMAGSRVGLIGKIGKCNFGQQFHDDIQKYNLAFTPVVCTEKPTTALMSYVTPDKDRSFAVLSGAGDKLVPEDIDFDMLDRARYTHLDLFLLFSDEGIKTVDYVAAQLQKNGSKLALSLNCEPLMELQRERIQKLARQADILVGSLDEFKMLFQVETNEQVFAVAKTLKAPVALTNGPKDVFVIDDSGVHIVPVTKINTIVDTCGAGDQFAAGYMKGIIDGLPAKQAAQQGCLWSQQIIQHYGALAKKAPPLLRAANQNTPQNPAKKRS